MRRKRTPVAKIIVLVMVPLVVIGGIAIFLFYDDPSLDAISACPRESGYTLETLSIALDATDTYGAAQRRSLVNRVWESVDTMKVYDRIKIYMIKPSEQIPLLNLCKPGRNLQNSPVEQQLREVIFKELISESLQHLDGTLPSSPIIESLGWIAADHERDGSTRRILLVSDLIEHSEIFSQYDPNWMRDYENNRSRIHNQCPNLEGVEIEILFPTRPSRPTQDNELVTWWASYLTACGGNVIRIERITGTN